MRATWAGRLSAPLGAFLVLVAGMGRGDEPGPPGVSATAAPTAPAVVPPSATAPADPKAGHGPPSGVEAGPGVKTPAPAPAARPEQPTETGGEGGTSVEAEAKAARAETLGRLERSKADGKDGRANSAAGKALRAALQERLHWLDEWDKAAKARQDAEHPEPSPERQAARTRGDLERVKALLDQSARNPEALLPDVFLLPAGRVNDASRAEMKEALEEAKGELKDWNAKLEKLRVDASKSATTLSPLRAERDKLHRRVSALKPRGAEREAAVASAGTPEEADLARERLANFGWESRVESERLKVQEALLALEAARGDLATLSRQDFESHVRLAARTLDRMQRSYDQSSKAQELGLQRAAASEQKRAAHVDDPLEKYRARRTADLLELRAQVVKFEDLLATSRYPSLEEQRNLADRADTDFDGVKALLDDGRVSHLDALRLNSEFRRIGSERGRIVGRELAAASVQLTFYENNLSAVETDLINDARDDRLEHEDLLERLPAPRRAEAQAVFQDVEGQHLALLERKRAALEKLAERADQTQVQIVRRLKTLDDQYGFIRTHIFWVRDEEPIGGSSLTQGRRELLSLVRTSLAMVLEGCDRSNWGRISPEFVAATLALVGLPWPLRRLQKSLCPRHHAAHGP